MPKLKIALALAAPMLIALAFWTIGGPRPPVSPPLTSCQDKQQQTVGPQQSSPENKNPSHPPAIIVNVLPPQETEAERNQKRRRADEKASLEQWSIESIAAAALFGGVLALSIVLLWLDTRKRRGTGTKTAAPTEKT